MLTRLCQLRRIGVKIRKNQPQLEFDIPENGLTEEQESWLQQGKQEVMDFLAKHPDFFDYLPVSHSQASLWFLHKMQPASNAYNMVSAGALIDGMDLELLGRAFKEVAQRHEALHCGYADQIGGPVMYIQQPVKTEVQITRAESWNDKEVNTWLEQAADKPFDLASANVCRLSVLENTRSQGVSCYIVFGLHHIAGDYRSFEVMVDETFDIYTQLVETGEYHLNQVKVQFSDWVYEQHRLLTSEKGQQLENYWLDKIPEEISPLELSADFPRPAEQTFDGKEIEFSFDEEKSQQLRAWAKSLGVSPFVVFYAIFQLILHRYTGRQEFLVGTPTTGRNWRTQKNMIGFTLNAILTPVQFHSNPPFSRFVQTLGLQLKDAIAHQAYPFTRLVEQFAGARDASRAPLFQQMFTLVNASKVAGLDRYYQREIIRGQRGSAHDLSLRMEDNKRFFFGRWRYNTALYKASSMDGLLSVFYRIVDEVLANPEQRVGLMPVAQPEQLSIAIGGGNSIPQGTALSAFEHQAKIIGDQQAVYGPDGEFSYQQLDVSAQNIARTLMHSGQQAGVPIAILLPKGRQLIAAMLASWKVASPYLALDNKLPQDRLLYMLKDSGCRFVLGTGSRPQWIDDKVTWIDLACLTRIDETIDFPLSHPQQVAYIIYTSGSTGLPKGVTVTQANLLNYVQAVDKVLGLPDNAVMASIATVAADLGHTALFGALLTGRRLQLIKEDTAQDPHALAAWWRENPIDCLKIVPSHLNGLLAASAGAELLPNQCLVFGGETLDWSLIRQVRQLAPECRLINHYGPTEATVGCLTESVYDQSDAVAPVAIGRPLANQQAYILDSYLNPVPKGAAGELYISGLGVAQGYLARPGLTAERFIPSPFAGSDRLYRTGDLARMSDDGKVAFLGRADQQVKIRGFRVELGEVECRIKQLAAVADALVMAKPALTGTGNRLLAYIVSGQGLAGSDITAQLTGVLPDYMLPTLYVFLDEFPRLANGKIDRQALPKPEQTASDSLHRQDDSHTVSQIKQIWRDVLGLQDIKDTDNFFELGGDSILSLQVVTRARQLGLSLTPKLLFDFPTVLALAGQLEPQRESETMVLLKSLWQEILARDDISPSDNFFELGGDSIMSLQLVAKARLVGLDLTPKQIFDKPVLEQLATQLMPQEGGDDELLRQVRAIWCEVLGRDDICASDNFFELGGDSILSLQLVEKARQSGLTVTPKQVFDQPILGKLCEVIAHANDGGGKQETSAKQLLLVDSFDTFMPKMAKTFGLAESEVSEAKHLAQSRADIVDLYPVSQLQKSLLVHEQLSPAGDAYFNQLVIEVDGQLNLECMRKAWQQLLCDSKVLRTGFSWEETQVYWQWAVAQVDIPWLVEDWSALSVIEQKARLSQFCQADRQKGFNLATPPLLRTAALKLADDKWWMVSSRHHLIVDGWTTGLMFERLFQFYQANISGNSLPEAVSVPEYSEYIAWLSQQDMNAAGQFWRQQLADVNQPTALPMQKSALSSEVDFRFESITCDLSLTAVIKQTSAGLGVTLNTFMQAAWAILLSKYNGQTQLVFGTACAGRPAELAGVSQMLGLFINSLPITVDVCPQVKLTDLLAAIQSTNAAVREFEHIALSDIQACSPLAAGTPLFESLFVFQNFPLAFDKKTSVAGLEVGVFSNRVQTNFPLNVEVTPGEVMDIKFSFDHNRLDQGSIQQLAVHYQELLRVMSADPSARVGELSFISETQKKRQLVDWNQTGHPVGRDSELVSLFEARVKQVPGHIALVSGAGELTYQALNCRVNQLAHWLMDQGIGVEQLVAVKLERTADLLICLLAILKSGAAYLPVDPKHPAERLEYILSHAEPSLMLSNDDLTSTSQQTCRGEFPRYSLDKLADVLAQQNTDNPGLPVYDNQLAYTLYTSGSTGKPKGVQITRGSFTNFLQAMQDQVMLQPCDNLLAVTTVTFDIAGLELFLPLVQGAKLVLASREQAMDGSELVSLIESHSISVMQATPATWQMLVEIDSRAWQGLKVLCGGEALSAELARRLLARKVALLNVYGPTETTVWSSAQTVTNTDICIGKPILNNHFYILDGSLNPVPAGVVGQLYIGGAGLARGYVKRADLTANAFIPNPFAGLLAQKDAGPGSRLYYTGDLARYRQDGSVEYLGRDDHQVKIRGFRIELGEIEAVLNRHPKVKQAVVVPRESESGPSYLAAYLTAFDDALDNSALIEHLKASLPDYMIPATFTLLDSFTLNPNGKVDRNALPQPELDSKPDEYAPPQGETEIQLANIWQDVLSAQNIGRFDNFFELGGTSLKLAKLKTGISKCFGVNLELAQFFAYASLAAQAGLIAEKLGQYEGEVDLMESLLTELEQGEQ